MTPPRVTVLRKAFVVGLCAGVAALLLVGISGRVVFTAPREDPLQRADAVFVLAGEHDGREDYGLRLVSEGLAPVLVLSNPYPQQDALMWRTCSMHLQAIEIICRRPDSLTTRGEAILARQLATERGWKKIVVVTWRYHLPRARLVFSQCYSSQATAVVMRGVPRSYNLTIVWREYVYAYQYAAFIKALIQGPCNARE